LPIEKGDKMRFLFVFWMISSFFAFSTHALAQGSDVVKNQDTSSGEGAKGEEGEDEGDFIDESEFVDVFDIHEKITKPHETDGVAKEVKKDKVVGDKKTPPLRIGGVGVLALGVVGMGLGLGTGIGALVLDKEIESNCAEGQCEPRYHKRLDRRDAYARSTDILLGVGAGVAVAGVLMIVFSYNWKEKRVGGEETAFSFRPVVGSKMVGTAMEWRF
jgi:hypothetical protein